MFILPIAFYSNFLPKIIPYLLSQYTLGGRQGSDARIRQNRHETLIQIVTLSFHTGRNPGQRSIRFTVNYSHSPE